MYTWREWVDNWVDEGMKDRSFKNALNNKCMTDLTEGIKDGGEDPY